MSADGTDGNKKDEPNADVTQNINGLYDKYVNDDRVLFATFLQAVDDIKIQMDGKSYSITKTGSVPVINKLIAGKMPNGNTNEITVPESFVKSTGLTNESIIGKEIKFSGGIFNWST